MTAVAQTDLDAAARRSAGHIRLATCVRSRRRQEPPNALQGFSQNRDQPVHIEAATLEVRDKQKEATFSGDVRVKQGDTGLRCKSLVVFYEQGGEDATKTKAMPAASPGPGGEQRIKRLEARGGRGRHAERSDRHRRTRHLRHEEQHRHADRAIRS